jgi:hypothetical protein
VEIEGYVEGFGGLEDGEELGGVEEFAVGGAVDEEAFEAEVVDAALEFFDGGGGIFEAGGGEGGEAVGVGGDGGGELVVDVVEDGGFVVGGEFVDAEGGEREDLEGDAAFVHGGDAGFAKVEELIADGAHGLGDAVSVGVGGLEEVGGDEVFFEGDGLHDDSDAGAGGRVRGRGWQGRIWVCLL